MVLGIAKYLCDLHEFGEVQPCFIRVDRPSIIEGLEVLASVGVKEVYVQPCLLSGQIRMPTELNDLIEWQGIDDAQLHLKDATLRLKFCQPIGFDERLVQALADSVRSQMVLYS